MEFDPTRSMNEEGQEEEPLDYEQGESDPGERLPDADVEEQEEFPAEETGEADIDISHEMVKEAKGDPDPTGQDEEENAEFEKEALEEAPINAEENQPPSEDETAPDESEQAYSPDETPDDVPEETPERATEGSKPLEEDAVDLSDIRRKLSEEEEIIAPPPVEEPLDIEPVDLESLDIDLDIDLDEITHKRELKRKIQEELDGRGAFNYYLISKITTTFFSFLAFFVLLDLAMRVLNLSWVDHEVFIHLVPYLGSDISLGILFLATIISIVNALLHVFDRYHFLLASFVPSGIMIIGLGVGATMASVSTTFQITMIVVAFVLVFICTVLDILAVFNYPTILKEVGRPEMEAFLESLTQIEEVSTKYNERARDLLAQEEEIIRAKDKQIQTMQSEIRRKTEEIVSEEENLRKKEQELNQVTTELDRKTEQLLEEQENLRIREQEMHSRLEREYKAKAQDFLQEEEEKLRVREQELTKLQEEANVKAELYDESQEKLRRKEEELSTLKSELETEIRKRLQEEEKAALAKVAVKKDMERRVERILFPFSAIVGQELMKKALILNAINPEIGGVLIPGQKGTGKSVTVRALAEILPNIEVVQGCRFNCNPEDEENFCDECKAKKERGNLETETRPIKVVDLPLNVTEDRLVGSIDIEKVLSEGVKAFEPGILAEVHRGILYVDEINLLDDYIVDILLDSAAMGVVNVEREGISINHPAEFIIIGSMNPEEGELRPQLLDRLALQVEVKGITDISQRIEIVNSREEFSQDPVEFRKKFESKQNELKERIIRAKEILPDVTTSANILEEIAKLCVDFNVDGHRADIIIERTARANAAFEGRMDVTQADVEVAGLMSLPHRMRLPPSERDEFGPEMINRVMDSY